MLNLKRGWNRIKNSNVLIIGKSGTGKNVVSKLSLQYDLKRILNKEKNSNN